MYFRNSVLTSYQELQIFSRAYRVFEVNKYTLAKVACVGVLSLILFRIWSNVSKKKILRSKKGPGDNYTACTPAEEDVSGVSLECEKTPRND